MIAKKCIYLCIAFPLVFFVGCGQKNSNQPAQQAISQPTNVPVQATSLTITGQIFIVTKGAENVTLGDVEVALINEDAFRNYLNSHELAWSNSLVNAMDDIHRASTNYSALFDKLLAAQKYHQHIMETAEASSDEWKKASDWSDKLLSEMDNLENTDLGLKLKSANDQGQKLWDSINYPATGELTTALPGDSQTTTTDSQGHFKFVIPAGSSNLLLVARSERLVGKDFEKYWWLTALDMDGNTRWSPMIHLNKSTTEIILSNNNKSLGVYLYFPKYFMYFTGLSK